MSNKVNGTLYIGVTSDLVKRVWQHKQSVIEGFTALYKLHMLVWYEVHETMETAIAKEKVMKNWKRSWKLDRIYNLNPSWRDLYEDICT